MLLRSRDYERKAKASSETNKRLLTLVDVEEGLTQFTGENGLRQVSEILFHHVGDVESRVTLVGNATGV